MIALGCNLPHDEQIFWRVTLRGFGKDYPDQPGIKGLFSDKCRTQSLDFFGTDTPPPDLAIQVYFPSTTDWLHGADTGACTFRSTTGQLTGPVRHQWSGAVLAEGIPCGPTPAACSSRSVRLVLPASTCARMPRSTIFT